MDANSGRVGEDLVNAIHLSTTEDTGDTEDSSV
jgi:hypothetical protein